MNWLIFTGKEDKKETEALAAFLKSKKIPYSIIEANAEYFSHAHKANKDDTKKLYAQLYKTTHCICTGMDDISPSPLFLYVAGLFSGKQLPVFLVPSKGNLPERIADSLGKTFADVPALLKSLKKNFPEYIKQEVQNSIKKKLFNLGVPLTPDSFSNYIARGDLDISKLFVKAGMDASICDSAGTPMLCIATRSNKLPLVSWLIKIGANINAASEDRGYTALMDAVWKNNYEIADLLVKAGADINTIAKDGQPLMVIAAGICNIKICKLLFENGGDIDLKDRMGMSALDYAKLFKKQVLIDLFEAKRR